MILLIDLGYSSYLHCFLYNCPNYPFELIIQSPFLRHHLYSIAKQKTLRKPLFKVKNCLVQSCLLFIVEYLKIFVPQDQNSNYFFFPQHFIIYFEAFQFDQSLVFYRLIICPNLKKNCFSYFYHFSTNYLIRLHIYRIQD